MRWKIELLWNTTWYTVWGWALKRIKLFFKDDLKHLKTWQNKNWPWGETKLDGATQHSASDYILLFTMPTLRGKPLQWKIARESGWSCSTPRSLVIPSAAVSQPSGERAVWTQFRGYCLVRLFVLRLDFPKRTLTASHFCRAASRMTTFPELICYESHIFCGRKCSQNFCKSMSH